MKRANLMVAAGAVLLLGGLVVVLVVSRHDGSSATEVRVPVVVARADLSPGQAGDDLVGAGKVGVDRLPKSQVEPGALTDTTALAGTIVGTSVDKGGQLVATDVHPQNLRSSSVTIPKGKEAVPITVGFTEGGAGYAGPGDHVDLFTSIAGRSGAKLAPYTKLLLSDVEVLDVSDEVAPLRATDTATDGATTDTAPRSTGDRITLLLALDPAQAEAAIFADTNDALRVALLPKGAKPSTTPGVSDGRGYPDQEAGR